MIRETCTEKCAAMPECTVCRRRKQPYGRDSRDNGLCDGECEGYHREPRAGHLWPSEWQEHVDRLEWREGGR